MAIVDGVPNDEMSWKAWSQLDFQRSEEPVVENIVIYSRGG